jgi:hypothetical protein
MGETLTLMLFNDERHAVGYVAVDQEIRLVIARFEQGRAIFGLNVELDARIHIIIVRRYFVGFFI